MINGFALHEIILNETVENMLKMLRRLIGEDIDLAEKHAGNIHLLLTDVIMPEMNGSELAKKLNSLYPDLQILYMSGYSANTIAHRGILDQGINFIQKPFSKKALAKKVRKGIGPEIRSRGMTPEKKDRDIPFSIMVTDFPDKR